MEVDLSIHAFIEYSELRCIGYKRAIMSKFSKMVQAKLDQWATEDAISCARAMTQGVPTEVFVYPTGLKMVHFTLKCGTARKVKSSIWEMVEKDGGKVTA